MSKVRVDVVNYLKAGFPILWIAARDLDAAAAAAREAVEEAGRTPAVWTVADGIPPMFTDMEHAAAFENSALIMIGGDRALPSVSMLVAQWCKTAKVIGAHVIVIASSLTVPADLEVHSAILDFPLPTAAELGDIGVALFNDARQGAIDHNAGAHERDHVTVPEQDEASIRSAMACGVGLTLIEAENAVSLSMIRHHAIRCETIRELKLQQIKKTGLLTLNSGSETFSDLGGLDALKSFAAKSLQSGKSRGVMLLGVPGTGKSAFAKALGNETGRPTLTLDIGALFGSLVGQTEERIRKALAIADAMAPCVLFIDEVEKALAGSASGNDSGVASRLLGTFLTWLNDHTTDVYTVCTSNDIERLPPEFVRAERFDAVFFMDTPSAADRAKIWEQYSRKFGVAAGKVADDNWTGAEIRACCRLADMLKTSTAEAAAFVVPVATTAAEKVTKLREFASKRCIDASRGGVFSATVADARSAAGSKLSTTPRRKIDPSKN